MLKVLKNKQSYGSYVKSMQNHTKSKSHLPTFLCKYQKKGLKKVTKNTNKWQKVHTVLFAMYL